MLSVNTNLSSLIVQNNLSKSTFSLNQAIERMTTGYKINHASDNAANYSISESYSSKLSSYSVAQDNIAMGLDMVTTASDTLDLISTHLVRIRDLAEQAANGTYGKNSLNAINSEICARADEIARVRSNAEYNGIDAFDGVISKTESSKFIKDINRINTDEITSLASIDAGGTLENGTYSISTADELAQLATMTNNGKIGQNCVFIMANDIDLSGYASGEGWTPIGNSSQKFKGTFDGNGYKITGLSINRQDEEYVGLFGYVETTGFISNLNVENANVCGIKKVGILSGETYYARISNCITSGIITSTGDWTGGITGYAHNGRIDNCYSSATLSGTVNGGIAGYALLGTIVENCYYSGNITRGSAGGIVGQADSDTIIKKCYSSGNINGTGSSGGIVGYCYSGKIYIENCCTDMNIQSTYISTGGIIGQMTIAREISIKDCSVVNNISNLTGLFVGICLPADNQITIENSTYNSAITSTTKYVSNLNNSDITTNNITTNDGTAPFTISNNAYITSYSDKTTEFQVGIHGDESNSISLSSGTESLNLVNILNVAKNIKDHNSAISALAEIDNALSAISAIQTNYGALQNRLESALESTAVSIDNLTSSRSTIKNADIAKVSSQYIKNQILQQAAATLLATANQSPSIALQLI